MALPHIQNSEAGRNKYDPVHNSIFEVRFTVPAGIQTDYAKDEVLLTEHVTKISGLDALNKAPGVGQQKFMGTDRSFIQPLPDNTHAEIEVTFTLNLRDDTDNYIYKLFRAWAALGYDISTGTRQLKRNYCADWMEVVVANREGTVYEDVIFKDVMMNGNLSGWNSDMDYDNKEAATLSVKFVSDWWQETMA